MFRGKAEFIGPETKKPFATLTEVEEHDGQVKVTVHLKEPFTLSGTARLEVYSSIKNEAIISVSADKPAGTVIHSFHGISSLGVLPDKEPVSLVKTPGGKLGTLLEVLGQGVIHQDRH